MRMLRIDSQNKEGDKVWKRKNQSDIQWKESFYQSLPQRNCLSVSSNLTLIIRLKMGSLVMVNPQKTAVFCGKAWYNLIIDRATVEWVDI